MPNQNDVKNSQKIFFEDDLFFFSKTFDLRRRLPISLKYPISWNQKDAKKTSQEFFKFFKLHNF